VVSSLHKHAPERVWLAVRPVTMCTVSAFAQAQLCYYTSFICTPDWSLAQQTNSNAHSGMFPAVYPDLSSREMVVPEDLINRGIGVQLGTAQMADLLSRMQLQAEAVEGSKVRVLVPPTRSDVLHACDVMEVGLSPILTCMCFNNCRGHDWQKQLKLAILHCACCNADQVCICDTPSWYRTTRCSDKFCKLSGRESSLQRHKLGMH